MEYHLRVRFPEEFIYKSEYSISHHVNRICASLQPALPDLRTQNGKQNHIKHELYLPRRKAHRVRPRNQHPPATAGQNTVDPGTHNRENHARRENIKNLTRWSPGYFGTEPIRQRHEKHSAEQAHVPDTCFVKPGFQKRKHLDSQHAVERMDDCNRYRRIPRHIQPPAQQGKPHGGKRCACRQQQQKRKFISQLHRPTFCPKCGEADTSIACRMVL